MSRSTHTFQVRVPIPAHIDVDRVIDALHEPKNLMNSQGLVRDFKPLQTDSHVAQLLHFASHPEPIESYSVTEGVTIVPLIGELGKRNITFPARFQNFDTGCRTMADAPSNVTVYGTWMVQKYEGDSEDSSGASWELVEDAKVEVPAILMWFVKKTIEKAHKDIFHKVLEKVEKDMRDS